MMYVVTHAVQLHEDIDHPNEATYMLETSSIIKAMALLVSIVLTGQNTGRPMLHR